METSRLLLLLCLSLVLPLGAADPGDVDVEVYTDRVIQLIEEDLFVGVTMDCFLMQDNWEGFDFRNRRMLNLAKGIAPSFLRIGGTACDSLTFDSQGTTNGKHGPRRPPFTTNFTMTMKDWDNLNKFVESVGWHMIFGVNAKKRSGREWDPWNAVEILQYAVLKGYSIYGLELSNEPELYPKSIYVEPEQLGSDYDVLRDLQQSIPELSKTLLIGPDTGQADSYFDRFLESDGGGVIDAATFHHYYFDGRDATLSQFLDPVVMDTLIDVIDKALASGHAHVPGKPIWLGETSSAYNTGAPGLSNSFMAGFLWLDKLGLSSKLGLKAVIRQDFYGGNYSLIQQNTFYPNPDYWLTLLYKRLVGGRVFNVTVQSDHSVRVYAHCVKQNTEYKYGQGALVLYAVNLKIEQVKFHLPQFVNQRCDVFWLSAVNNNLTATSVNLNGVPIELLNDDIPQLSPVNVTSPIVVPPHTLGFIVLPNANINTCMN